MEVLQCPDQSWCCEGGANNLNATNCCEKGKGSWIVNGQVTGVNPNSTSTSSSSSISSPTKTAAPTRSTQSSSEIAAAATGTKSPVPQNTVVASSGGGGSHTGAIVGGIVGGVAALLLIAGASWFLVRRRSSHAQPLVQPMGSYHGAPPGMPEKDGVSHQYRAEMGAQKPGLEGHELEAEPVNRELDGATRSELGGLGAKR